MTLDIHPMTGDELEAHLDDLARLRIQVFRAFPYLYDGDLDYERNYLRIYRDNPSAILVGAFDDGRLVGAATGMPMEDNEPQYVQPFAEFGLTPEATFYCGESVLLPEYRGQGAGHAFFDHREAHARDLGRVHSVFCAVMRPDDHPLKPDDHSPLDPFWRKRGYERVDDLYTFYHWKDVDEDEESVKQMAVWWKQLATGDV